MIDVDALRQAFRARLTGDSTLMGLVEGVFGGQVPATQPYVKPNMEYGVQAAVSENFGYTVDAADVRMRLMGFGKGSAPGVGSLSPVYAALQRADAVLTASPLVITGHKVIQLRWDSAIPGVMPSDESGYLRPQAGNLYKILVHRG
jgi:hypothetical protein